MDKLSKSKITTQQVQEIIDNPDCNNILISIQRRFSDLDKDDLESFKYQAVWIALVTYDGRTKFTTHLFNQMKFLCLKERNNITRKKRILYKNDMALDNVSVKDNLDLIDFYNSIDQLSKDEKNVLFMYYEDGLNMAEIADQLGISKQAVSLKIKNISNKIKLSCDM